MNKPHISIPKPCHENWDAMHPREQGRHCDACDKTVIDFTGKSEKEIGEYFAEHAGTRICGHFRISQLHKTSRLHAFLLQLHASASLNIKRHALRAIALFFIGMMMTMTVYAPPKIVPVIIRDYSLTFGKKQYEKDTIFGDANSHHPPVA